MNWQASDLIAFERRVYDAFAAKQCKGPVHLSGGNEEQLIRIFKDISREDWIFSTYRSHLHGLLHGLDPEWLFQQILDGHSMNIMSPEHRFFTSAIVGGCLPIAVGVAAALKRKNIPNRVWIFIGDMTMTTGDYSNAARYATGQHLPISFIVEANGWSCDTPVMDVWGKDSPNPSDVLVYGYERIYPHVGIGKNVF